MLYILFKKKFIYLENRFKESKAKSTSKIYNNETHNEFFENFKNFNTKKEEFNNFYEDRDEDFQNSYSEIYSIFNFEHLNRSNNNSLSLGDDANTIETDKMIKFKNSKLDKFNNEKFNSYHSSNKYEFLNDDFNIFDDDYNLELER